MQGPGENGLCGHLVQDNTRSDMTENRALSLNGQSCWNFHVGWPAPCQAHTRGLGEGGGHAALLDPWQLVGLGGGAEALTSQRRLQTGWGSCPTASEAWGPPRSRDAQDQLPGPSLRPQSGRAQWGTNPSGPSRVPSRSWHAGGSWGDKSAWEGTQVQDQHTVGLLAEPERLDVQPCAAPLHADHWGSVSAPNPLGCVGSCPLRVPPEARPSITGAHALCKASPLLLPTAPTLPCP